MTKTFNFDLKIKGGGREGGTCEVLRPCHQKKIETYTNRCRVWCAFTTCIWLRQDRKVHCVMRVCWFTVSKIVSRFM